MVGSPFSSISAEAIDPLEVPNVFIGPHYEIPFESSSNTDLLVEAFKTEQKSFEERTAAVFQDLASRQQDIGVEFEKAIMANLSRLNKG
jgi:hypothetical protein